MVFPNPISNKLFFSKTIQSQTIIKIEDITGRLVVEQFHELPVSEIDLSVLQNGIYFISFISNQGVITKKIVKQ